jgi:hypothetical protein
MHLKVWKFNFPNIVPQKTSTSRPPNPLKAPEAILQNLKSKIPRGLDLAPSCVIFYRKRIIFE